MEPTRKLLSLSALAGLLFCSTSIAVDAATIGLVNGNSFERDALVSTLTSFGHTVTSTIDASLDLVISAPGNSSGTAPGVPYLQISDWGADLIPNSWIGFAGGTIVSITTTGLHPILTGVSTSWDSLGFWRYGFSSDFVGWSNSGTGLADANWGGGSANNVLDVVGSNIYIGWNVFGPDATANDLLLLRNSIDYLTTGTVTPVPLPAALPLFVAALGAFGLVGWVRRRRDWA